MDDGSLTDLLVVFGVPFFLVLGGGLVIFLATGVVERGTMDN